MDIVLDVHMDHDRIHIDIQIGYQVKISAKETNLYKKAMGLSGCV